MDEIKKIGYRPHIQYQDEYEADIDFSKFRDKNDSNNDDNTSSPIEDLLDQGNTLENLLNTLPDFLGDAIKDHVDPIIDFVESELEGETLEKVPVELEWDYDDHFDPRPPVNDNTNGENDNNSNNGGNNGGNSGDSDNNGDVELEDDDNKDDEMSDDIWVPDDDVPIYKEIHDKEEIIKKEYIKNIYDMFDEYFSNLHNIVSRFWSGMFYSIMNKDSSEIDMILNNIVLNSSQIESDSKHVLDSVVRSEINRDMKLRYFANNFNAENSMKHLKNLKATYELRFRYAKITKNANPSTRAEQMSNNILDGMSISYDMKYEKVYENVYRYLISSNVILEDTLMSALQSLKGKQTLIDTKGVNKDAITTNRR